MKKQKGITLIALIITIIVMLILVGVSVSVALNGGLFKTAKQAAEQTKLAVQEESSLKYEYEIAKATGKYTGSYDEYVLQEKYGLRIGDKVNYDESDGTPLAYETDASKGTYTSNTLVQGTYTLTGDGEGEIEAGDLEWRVLGINDEGQVELISTTTTRCALTLRGKTGYLNAVTENGVQGTLDTFCNNIYGKGTGAKSARSLTAEDINKLGNYTPATGTKYTYKYFTVAEGASTAGVYGINSENASADISNWSYSANSTFDAPNWTIDSTNVGPEELENTTYSYKIADQVKITDPVNMATLLNSGLPKTWLATHCVNNGAGGAGYQLRCISDGYVTGDDMFYFGSGGGVRSASVRPVVTLKSDVTFTKVSDNNFNISL